MMHTKDIYTDKNLFRKMKHTKFPTCSQKTGPYFVWKKKVNFQLMDFALPIYHRMKVKEIEKLDEYQYFARVLENYRTHK